jgi:O-antigen chain-terminating methyltransferase
VAATGIDQNAKGANNATRLGLEIEIGDIFDILPAKPSGYYGAVTAFHVIEHLETRLQLRLLRETFRILKPGGLLLLEWPNIENLRVATYGFWLDPTHVQPLPVDLVRFMVEFSGFRELVIQRFRAGQGVQSNSKRGVLERVAGWILGYQSTHPATEKLNDLLTPGMDVSLRANKPL